jgi:hypothetical protein
MSKLNINRNIFLEKEELMRFQKFMLESPINKVFLANTVKWGIIDTSEGTDSNDFKIEAGTNSSTIKISNLSRALDKDGLLIEQSPVDNVSIPTQGVYYWYKIAHTYSKYEEGTVSVSTQGVVTGIGTKFTDVLRGQSTEVPVKIKLGSFFNSAVYEVVDVIDDLNMILQGDSFTAESGLSYYVIGSTPLGETVTSSQQNGLYSYDSCSLIRVTETVTNTPPSGLVADKQFWVARVVSNGGVVTIQDKRDGYYWEYYIRGVSDKLDKNNNLNDLTNKPLARVNLGNVLTETEIRDLLNIDVVGWRGMEKGNKVNSSSQFEIKREGNIVTITATFSLNAALVNTDILASIPYSTIGLKAAPSYNIFFTIPLLDDSGDRNRGILAYIEKRTTQDVLNIKINEVVFLTSDKVNKPMSFTVTYIAG